MNTRFQLKYFTLTLFFAAMFISGCGSGGGGSSSGGTIGNANIGGGNQIAGPTTQVTVQFGVLNREEVLAQVSIPGIPPNAHEVVYQFCDADGDEVFVDNEAFEVNTSNQALRNFRNPDGQWFPLAPDARGIRMIANLPNTVRAIKFRFPVANGPDALAQIILDGSTTQFSDPTVITLANGEEFDTFTCDFRPATLGNVNAGTTQQIQLISGQGTDLTDLFSWTATGPVTVTNGGSGRGQITTGEVTENTPASLTARLGTKVKTLNFTVVPTTGVTKTIEIRPAGGITTVAVGQTLQLSAFVQPGNMPAGAGTWSIERTNPGGDGTVSSTGLFTPSSPGAITVVFVQDGTDCRGSINLTVASVRDIRIVPDNPRRNVGTHLPLFVEITYSNDFKTLFNPSFGTCTWSTSNNNCFVNDRGICEYLNTGSCQVQVQCEVFGSTFSDTTNCQTQNLSCCFFQQPVCAIFERTNTGNIVTLSNFNLDCFSACFDSSCNFIYCGSSNGGTQFLNCISLNSAGQGNILSNFEVDNNVTTIRTMDCQDFYTNSGEQRRLYCGTDQGIYIFNRDSSTNFVDSQLGFFPLTNVFDIEVNDKGCYYLRNGGSNCEVGFIYFDSSFLLDPSRAFTITDPLLTCNSAGELDIYEGFADENDVSTLNTTDIIGFGGDQGVGMLRFNCNSNTFQTMGTQTHPGRTTQLQMGEYFDSNKHFFYFVQDTASTGFLVFHQFDLSSLGAFNNIGLSNGNGQPIHNVLNGFDLAGNNTFIDAFATSGSLPTSTSTYQPRFYNIITAIYNNVLGGTPGVFNPPLQPQGFITNR